jgi:hypothetical protein
MQHVSRHPPVREARIREASFRPCAPVSVPIEGISENGAAWWNWSCAGAACIGYRGVGFVPFHLLHTPGGTRNRPRCGFSLETTGRWRAAMNETWVEYTVWATNGNEVTYSVPLRGRLVIVPTSVAGRIVLQLVGPGGEQVECVSGSPLTSRQATFTSSAKCFRGAFKVA